MIFSVHFRRGDRCAHDARRECTPCFKASMALVYAHVFGDGFEEAWARQPGSRAEDVVETFECFERGPIPGEPDMTLSGEG